MRSTTPKSIPFSTATMVRAPAGALTPARTNYSPRLAQNFSYVHRKNAVRRLFIVLPTPKTEPESSFANRRLGLVPAPAQGKGRAVIGHRVPGERDESFIVE